MVHGVEASTKKNSAPVSLTVRSTSDKASALVEAPATDSGSSAPDA
jgi:hypothetical protein